MNLLDKNASNLKKLYKTQNPDSVTIYNFFPFKKLSLKEKKELLNEKITIYKSKKSKKSKKNKKRSSKGKQKVSNKKK